MGLMDSLSSGIAEAADAVKGISLKQIQADIEEQKQQRLAEIQGEIARKNIDYGVKVKEDSDKRTRENMVSAQNTAAQEIADKRKQGLIDTARSKYVGSDIGLTAVDDAVKRGAYDQTPTAEDLLEARVKTGYESPDKIVDNNQKAADRADMSARWHKQFQAQERHWDKQVAIQSEMLNLKKEERKELKSAVADYGKAIKDYRFLSQDADPQLKSSLVARVESAIASAKRFGVTLQMPDTTKSDPLSSIVAGAQFVERSMDATPEQKKDMVDTVSGSVKHYGNKSNGSEGKQPVTMGGKVIGYARTQEEADALVAALRKQKAL